ncbi:MAG: restriction endonuclease subunit S [Acidobacteria bacterium]|nr:restriction endonuclease subunit S [Acidobacteriota bacterium]
MIADLKPYPEYKDSGLPWLGCLPSHWKVVRNGSLFSQRNQTGFGHLPILEVSLKTGVRVRDFENSARKQVMSDFGKYKRAVKGDLAYNMMRMWQGAIGVAPIDGLVSPAYVVARPYPEVAPQYYSYLFRTGIYMAEIDAYSTGIVKDRNRLYWDQFKRMASLFPPSDEQAAIIRFLDYANRRLERAIRAKRKVIALLNEQKQAIIHSAVTRGLDSNAPLKHSGIPWLGEIPAHWERIPIRQIAARGKSSIVNGPFGSDLLTTELKSEGVPVIYIRDISSGNYRRVSKSYVTPIKAAELGFCKVIVGDVLVAKVGDPPGTAATYPEGEPDGIVTQDVIRIRPASSRIMAAYLVTLLNSQAGRSLVGPISVESTRGRFSLPDFKGLFVILPPIDEQVFILEAILKATKPLETVNTRAEREIALLREYCTRLIADVVTGKLDVRGVSASLPDEAYGLESNIEGENLEDEAEALMGDEEVTDE